MTRRAAWTLRTPLTKRVAVYNLGDNRKATSGDLDAINAYRPDAIVLSEALDRWPLLESWAGKHAYLICASDQVAGGRETVILYRRNSGVTRAWVHPASPRYTNRDKGAGGKHGIPAKATPHVRFGRGLRRLHVAGAHLIPSPYLPARRPWHRWHLDSIVAVLRRRVGGIVAAGDFNSPPNHRRMAPLRDAGYTQELHRDTLRNWQPDHVWVRRVRSVQVVRLLDLSSDHRAVIVDVTY